MLGKSYTVYTDGKRKIVSIPRWITAFEVRDKAIFVQLNDHIVLMCKDINNAEITKQQLIQLVDSFVATLSTYYNMPKNEIIETLSKFIEAYKALYGVESG